MALGSGARSDSHWSFASIVAIAGLAGGFTPGCNSDPDGYARPPAPSFDGGGDGAADGPTDDAPACAPKSCVQLSAECGTVPDGCGGTVNCGTCPPGQNCGGDGDNRCGVGDCTPKTCTQLNAACGMVSDGCGNVLSCGECIAPDTCGGGGVPNQCGCKPSTCDALGAECGLASDGCDGLIDCGDCPTGKICGGGQENQCSDIPCEPDTCADIGAECGTHPDGCNSVINCGSCTAPETCGGGGNPKKCGCIPTSCAAEGAECGYLDDGCGQTLSCGSCEYGSCQNHQCVCNPTTCAAQDADCGTIPDGCGSTLSCGTCLAPEQCGASGVPNQCGCNTTICPAFYQNGFEGGTDFPSAWTAWHNCAATGEWFVDIEPYPAPSGGASNLRFHTTTFQGNCDWPGAYAQSPAWPVTPGKTYRVESWSRHGGSTAGITILFFKAGGDLALQVEELFLGDSWEYQQNPPASAVAPANASTLQVRIKLTTPEAYLDFDRLAVFEWP